jgi:hypothetical protein
LTCHLINLLQIQRVRYAEPTGDYVNYAD